jgi:hypothetical protein
METLIKHPLAHKNGIDAFFGLMIASGLLCPKCSYATRATSKNWAKCKKCGERVRRVKYKDL